MQVKVNDKVIEIFAGARVENAVQAYSRTAWRNVRGKKYSVFDGFGHEISPDGELSGGEELFIRRPETKKGKR